jgi:hypothetical protein
MTYARLVSADIRQLRPISQREAVQPLILRAAEHIPPLRIEPAAVQWPLMRPLLRDVRLFDIESHMKPSAEASSGTQMTQIAGINAD